MKDEIRVPDPGFEHSRLLGGGIAAGTDGTETDRDADPFGVIRRRVGEAGDATARGGDPGVVDEYAVAGRLVVRVDGDVPGEAFGFGAV